MGSESTITSLEAPGLDGNAHLRPLRINLQAVTDSNVRDGVTSPVYLDHHASTPMDPRVLAIMVAALEETFGNSNSADHSFGAAAAGAIEASRARVAALVGSPEEDVRFTSGATEALRLVLGFEMASRPGPFKVAASRIEHPAVVDLLEAAERAGYVQVEWIGCNSSGVVTLRAIDDALSRGPSLLWLMAANNEVGTLQPVQEAASRAHQAGVTIAVDATQAAGRIPLQATEWAVDYLALSAHKIYGPKGVGALVGPGLAAMRSPFVLEAHSPTPNAPAIAGFGEACRLRNLEMVADEVRISELRNRLEGQLLATTDDLVVNGDRNNRLAGNLHISARDAPNDMVVAQLRNTVAISTGAACASGAGAPGAG